MDAQAQKILAELIRNRRIAALGTLRGGGPLVSMILYAVSPDFSAFYLHVSRLAQPGPAARCAGQRDRVTHRTVMRTLLKAQQSVNIIGAILRRRQHLNQLEGSLLQ